MEKLLPKLRFPGFDGEWEKNTLGEAFTIFNGYAFSSTSSVDEGVLWVKIADVGIQEMKKNNLSYLPASLKEKHKKFIISKGDFVVALTRPILNGKLKIAQINSFFDGALLNQRVGKIVSNNSHYFIYSLLQKDELIKSIENNIAGSDPPNLSPNEINSIEISYPPLPEQQKIASFLSAVDEKIQQLSRKKELLEQYKKGIMQQLFSGKLRFKDENGKDYPEWEEKKLGDLGEFKGGGTPSTEISEYWDGDIPWISSSDLIENDISNINVTRFITEKAITASATKLIPVNSVLFISRVGVGKLAVSKRIMCTSQDFANFIPNEIDSYFLAYYFLKNNNILISYAQGTSIKGFTSGDLKSIKVSYPVLAEQQKIANFLSCIDVKIEQVNGELVKTQEFKKGLLQQIFV